MKCKFILYICVSLTLVARCAYSKLNKTPIQLYCGEGEESRNCPICDPTCEDPHPPCPRIICPPTPRCLCLPGYARVGPHRCIPIEECPPLTTTSEPETTTVPSCPPGEEFNECATACEGICSEPPPEFCSYICLPPQCQCIEGYARDDYGVCIPRYDCPPLPPTTTIPSCPPGEEFNECATACEGICSEPPPEICSDICLPPQCQCIGGYARDDYGVCIPRYECPPLPPTTTPPFPICPLNEEYNECANPCEEKCSEPPPSLCPASICLSPQCQCIEGYARNDYGVCIPRYECPPLPPTTTASVPSCPSGEQFNECATACEEKCSEPPPEACILICLPPQCQCIEGYARNDYGVCIPRYECPPLPPTTIPNVVACNLDCMIHFRCVIVYGKPECVPILP